MFKIFQNIKSTTWQGTCGLPFPQRNGSRWKHSAAGQLFGNTRWDKSAQRGTSLDQGNSGAWEKCRFLGQKFVWAPTCLAKLLGEKHESNKLPTKLKVKSETLWFYLPPNSCVISDNLLNFPEPWWCHMWCGGIPCLLPSLSHWLVYSIVYVS